MPSKGLLAAGYRYLTVDDCWMESQRDASGNLIPVAASFPSGMKALGDYLHAKGLKPLKDSSRAVAVFNRGSIPAPVTVLWSDFRVDGKKRIRVRDLWAHMDIAAATDSLRVTVLPHATLLLRMYPLDAASAGRTQAGGTRRLNPSLGADRTGRDPNETLSWTTVAGRVRRRRDRIHAGDILRNPARIGTGEGGHSSTP